MSHGMDDDLVARALAAVGKQGSGPPIGLAGSMSRAGVYRVQVDGRDAVLKVTTSGRDQRISRRELAFYRHLADRVPVKTPTLLAYADEDDLTVLVLTAHPTALPAQAWDEGTWLDVARGLAVLHSMEPPTEDLWRHEPWLRKVVERSGPRPLPLATSAGCSPTRQRSLEP